jgi:hypothetical protein
MKRGSQTDSGSTTRRIGVLAAEVLFAIGVVVLIVFYATHKHDPWMPRPEVLTASFWVSLGLVGIALSFRTKRLRSKLALQYGTNLSAFEWMVPLAMGIAALVFGASRLSDIYGRGTLPNGAGRFALFAFYSLAGTMSFVSGVTLLGWGFRRVERSVEGRLAHSEAISIKERISMVLPGTLLAYEGVRLLIAAGLIVRAP